MISPETLRYIHILCDFSTRRTLEDAYGCKELLPRLPSLSPDMHRLVEKLIGFMTTLSNRSKGRMTLRKPDGRVLFHVFLSDHGEVWAKDENGKWQLGSHIGSLSYTILDSNSEALFSGYALHYYDGTTMETMASSLPLIDPVGKRLEQEITHPLRMDRSFLCYFHSTCHKECNYLAFGHVIKRVFSGGYRRISPKFLKGNGFEFTVDSFWNDYMPWSQGTVLSSFPVLVYHSLHSPMWWFD